MENIMGKVIFIALFSLLLSSCNFITIVDSKSETAENFKVDLKITPTQLINKYLDTSYSNNNYFITFYSVGCMPCYRQVPYCNKLCEDTKGDFIWIACTIYDSIEDYSFKENKKYPDIYNYQYSNFHDVNGLRSSLRNLYYSNTIPIPGQDPMNIIIVNDTIVEIMKTSISTEDVYLKYKYRLDSLAHN